MGIWDAFTDLVEATKPWSTVEAEAPADEPKGAADTESKEEDSEEAKSEDDGDDEGEEEEEEEEDEEEVVDPKEKLEEDCKNSKQCHEPKHHFDECVERVTAAQSEEGGAKEDCIEEFFHLAHCASQCAAPKLWSVLK